VINLDFYFFNDNVYDFGKKNLMPMFKIMSDEEEVRRNQFEVIENQPNDRSAAYMAPDGQSPLANNEVIMTLIHELANRLFTVCAIHMERPYI